MRSGTTSKGHLVYLSVPRVDMPLSLRREVVYLMDRMVDLMEKQLRCRLGRSRHCHLHLYISEDVEAWTHCKA
jgi:hypothetical protein